MIISKFQQFKKPKNIMYPARSVTLPLESNPIMLRITRELNKLKSWEESSTSAAETISIGLSGIGDLYKCVGEFLSLPFIQQALSLHHRERCGLELLEGSKKVLEICSATQEIALQMKQACEDLRDSLNVNHHDSGVSGFCGARKRIIRSAKKTVLSLRRAENESFGSSEAMLNDDRGISVVIKVLTCVSIISISILEALLYFLAMPVSKCKIGRFSFLSKLMSKPRVSCDGLGLDRNRNELENLNFALSRLCSSDKFKDENLRVAFKRLSSLEVGLEGIQNGAESMFRQLSQTRVTLLKIFSS